MKKLDKVINQLSHLYGHDELPSIVSQLKELQALVPNEIIVEDDQNMMIDDEKSEEIITKLRSKLAKILTEIDDEEEENSFFIGGEIYNALLILTELKPLNMDDPITMDIIDKDDRVFVSTGHQFSIIHLAQFHNTRFYRGSTLQETETKMWMINPITNFKFSPRDVGHIVKIGFDKGIEFENLHPKAEYQEDIAESKASLLSLIPPDKRLDFLRRLFDKPVFLSSFFQGLNTSNDEESDNMEEVENNSPTP